MTGEENSDAKLSFLGEDHEVEGDDSARTVNCLRGRLLAERMASRNARDQARQLGNKLRELENLLKQEAKSRNRAEKKLKFLMRRLQSKNISYIPDESPKGSVDLEQNDSKISSLSIIEHYDYTTEGSSSSVFEDQNVPQKNRVEDNLASADEQSDQLKCNQNYNDSTSYEQSVETCNEDGHKQEDDVDNSMALVAIDTPQEAEKNIDPEVLDATVKEVLGALRRAKEQLQSSMEERRRRSMIRVG